MFDFHEAAGCTGPGKKTEDFQCPVNTWFSTAV